MGVVNGLLDAASDIYATREISRERPIPRSYVQVAKIANYIVGGIFAVSTLLETARNEHIPRKNASATFSMKIALVARLR